MSAHLTATELSPKEVKRGLIQPRAISPSPEKERNQVVSGKIDKCCQAVLMDVQGQAGPETTPVHGEGRWSFQDALRL